MSYYFSKPYEPFGRDINVKVDLSLLLLLLLLLLSLIMQQKQILKIFHMLILPALH